MSGSNVAEWQQKVKNGHFCDAFLSIIVQLGYDEILGANRLLINFADNLDKQPSLQITIQLNNNI